MENKNLNCTTITSVPRNFSFDSTPYDFEDTEIPGSWRLHPGMGLTEEDQENNAWYPVMNLIYPLPSEFRLPENWRECLISTTVVKINSECFLALTGGGRGFSWEICESFIRLGYRPPTHFCELAAMVGRGKSKKDLMITQICTESLRIHAQWIEDRLLRMQNRFPLI